MRGEVQGLRSELTTLQDEVVRQGHAVEAEAATRSREIAISTYGQINAIGGGTRNSLIDAESFELVFSGQPHDRISFFSELEFERAASVGADRGGEVLVEQAYVDYAWSDALALRAGVILVPFGNNEPTTTRAARCDCATAVLAPDCPLGLD
ncbi:MAG: porin [Lysobacterales bacterium]